MNRLQVTRSYLFEKRTKTAHWDAQYDNISGVWNVHFYADLVPKTDWKCFLTHDLC
jgi:hypothetical protein